MTNVLFPQVSQKDPDAQGALATWFAIDGGTVAEGELIAEVAVDKVDMEVLAPCAGTISLLAEEGAVLTQGVVIATIT